MTGKTLSRWQASGLHFLICVAIAAAVVTVMLAVWYPRPLFEAAGGNDLLFILVGVDVTLGPILTLVVFKAGKPGMKFDLGVIAAVQIAALIYGGYVVFLARPAFVVFVKDRFELVAAAELEPEALAQARYPQFRKVPVGGPLFAAADMPSDPAERQKVIEAALAGRDLQHFPRLYVPYAERRGEVLAKAKPLSKLRAEPEVTAAIDEYLAGAGASAKEAPGLLLRTRFAWLVVIVDPQTAKPVKMLLGEKFLQR
jgi:hypothetical protein